MNNQLGFKVKINHAHHGKMIFRNVTEIHWKYPTEIPESKVAFESDIHSIGNTFFCNQILEFEAILEIEQAKDFREEI